MAAPIVLGAGVGLEELSFTAMMAEMVSSWTSLAPYLPSGEGFLIWRLSQAFPFGVIRPFGKLGMPDIVLSEQTVSSLHFNHDL